MKNSITAVFSAAAVVCLMSGCAGQKHQPVQSGFLSAYHHMTPVDETTSRYVDAARLGSYNKFKIVSVKVLVKNYDGKPITSERQQRMIDYTRNSIVSALQDRYPIVETSGTDTAEIRVAITDAYKSGNQLGLSVEGEIQDSFSGVQVAAVVRTDLGNIYVGNWWDKTSGREIVDAWSKRLRQSIDSAHGR